MALSFGDTSLAYFFNLFFFLINHIKLYRQGERKLALPVNAAAVKLTNLVKTIFNGVVVDI